MYSPTLESTLLRSQRLITAGVFALLAFGLAMSGCQSPARHDKVLSPAQEATIAANVLKAPPKISHPMAVNFDNKITLLGYDIAGRPRKGGSFDVTMFFRVDQSVSGDWKIFCHLEMLDDPATPSPDGRRVTVDHYGVQNLYPVSQWKKGEIIRDKVTIEVPANWRSGETKIWLGFFDWAALERGGKDRRLPIFSSGKDGVKPAPDRFLLATLNVR